MSAPPPPPPYRKIGKGSYGCVVRPALPNVNNSGKRIEYPENISKVFLNSVNATGKIIPSKLLADKAVTTNERIETYGIPRTIYPHYRRTFNARAEAEDPDIANIRRINGNPCNIHSNNANIGVIRMPYLGIDVYDLYDAFLNKTNPDVIQEIQSLSLLELLEKGVKPLFHTVEMLRRHGRIHLDIKPENVMIQPLTGEMHIVDYDLERSYDTIDKFLPNPEIYFLYPPELLLWQPGPIEDLYGDWLRSEYENKLVYVKTYKPRYMANIPFRQMMNKFVFRDEPKDIRALIDYKSTHTPVSIQREIVDTLDSYCLARSLLLLFGVYIIDKNWNLYTNELLFVIGNILAPMYSFEVKRRLRIDGAIILLDKLIDRLKVRYTTPKRAMSNATPRSLPNTPIKGPQFDGGTRKKLKSVRRTKKGRRRA